MWKHKGLWMVKEMPKRAMLAVSQISDPKFYYSTIGIKKPGTGIRIDRKTCGA